MTDKQTFDEKYTKAANIIVRAGIIPFAVSETLIEILQFYLDNEDVDFIIKNFDKRASLSHEQLKEKSGLSDIEIEKVTTKLAKKGIIFNEPNSKGVVVYRVLPLIVVGTFEYTFMNELRESDDLSKHKKIAKLYEKLLEELKDIIQKNYDNLLPFFEKQPPTDRTVPTFTTDSGKNINIIVNKEIDGEEQILPTKTVEGIINKYDEIAVGHCFCRNYNRMLDKSCEFNAPSEVCLTFGKSARYTVTQGFARSISKDEALTILKKSEEAGLIHKAFHNGSDINKDENSICNCCKDCCDTFTLWRNGVTPMVNSTNYLSIINTENCTGCEECAVRCPVDAITISNDVAIRKESYCIGCGVCARFCPTDSISLQEGLRRVCVPPPRMR